MQLTERQRQRGIVVDRLGAAEWRRAEAASGRILADDSVDVEGLLLLGLSVAARGQTQRAAAILDRVARERPNEPHPCGDLPALLPRFSRAQITAQFQACLKLAPEDFRLRQAFATFLQDGGEHVEAIALLREGLVLHPRSAPAQHGMGLALAEVGQNTQAIWHFQQAVALDPDLAPSWANLGLLLKVEGQFERSLAAYARAVAAAPNDAQIRVNRAVALLQAGRWEEAWPDYEWRLRVKGAVSLPLALLLPALREAGDLTGRTILLTHEEGFGDTLQFLRYAPLLAERGAQVLAWVPGPLVRLTRGVTGIETVITGDATLPPFDYHCPFVSLPRAFESTVATVPSWPYLQADPALTAEWAQRLPAARLRVGLAWAGQARPWLAGFSTVDRRRSVSLTTFAPLAAVPDVLFVSLQKGPAQDQVQVAPEGMALVDPMAAAADFADTAAIIANLDVVISVDTAVVHLAGAMGKPVFLIDRYDNCWRWLSGRADSPWYPSLTIFRQDKLGDWSAPMARAAAALAAMAAYRGEGGG
ncbi:MAG TPA: tetratricopeptide repeat protein [Acetobacteraceae bacterium]|nr:tetratricopeptide repeat protein [Acetobacteraceae bacterium]